MIATRFSGRADRYTEQDESRTRAMPNDRVQLRPPRRLLAASAAVCTKTQKLLRVKELDPRVCVIDVLSVDSVLIPASHHSPRFTDHCPLSPIPFLFILLRTLLHSAKSQLLCFHGIPDSLYKTPGGGGTATPACSNFGALPRLTGLRGTTHDSFRVEDSPSGNSVGSAGGASAMASSSG